jgi:peptidoglycan hydrolase-like protein with peptidoglycan-binding domain
MKNVGDGGASGVAQRLALLGYSPGTLDGTDDEDLADAIARYQSDKKLEATGTITPELVERLGAETVE